MSIQGTDGKTQDLFTSGGFALIDAKGAQLNLIEAFNVEDLDGDKARAGLAEAAKTYEQAQGKDKGAAYAAVEIYQAMVDALKK